MAFEIVSWVWILIIIAWIWTIPWKIVALWKSARNNQIVWFIIMFFLNTLAILEILYIFIFQKKKKK